jgi:hypothetical protein
MKNLPRYLCAGALALAFGLATVSAQETEKKKERGPSKADLAKYDANKDGQLDEAEAAKMKADKDAARQARLEKYDANKDGKINKEEKAAEDADKAAAKAEKKAKADAKKAEKAKEKTEEKSH